MSGKIEISRELAERILHPRADWSAKEELRALLAAPVVERRPTGQWRIPVNGDWFYGTKEQCERERAEYETTFTAEDFEEAGVVAPEQLWSLPPVPVVIVLPTILSTEQSPHYSDNRDSEYGYLAGYNACLDKIKELNK